jgi:hypothetical protein
LLYSNENWIIKGTDGRGITKAEMKYMRTAGYNWTSYETNTEAAKETKIIKVLDKIQ